MYANWVLITALLDSDLVQFMLLDQGRIDALRDYALTEVGLPRDEVDAIFPPRHVKGSWKDCGVIRHAPNHRHHLYVCIMSELIEDVLVFED